MGRERAHRRVVLFWLNQPVALVGWAYVVHRTDHLFGVYAAGVAGGSAPPLCRQRGAAGVRLLQPVDGAVRVSLSVLSGVAGTRWAVRAVCRRAAGPRAGLGGNPLAAPRADCRGHGWCGAAVLHSQHADLWLAPEFRL